MMGDVETKGLARTLWHTMVGGGGAGGGGSGSCVLLAYRGWAGISLGIKHLLAGPMSMSASSAWEALFPSWAGGPNSTVTSRSAYACCLVSESGSGVGGLRGCHRGKKSLCTFSHMYIHVPTRRTHGNIAMWATRMFLKSPVHPNHFCWPSLVFAYYGRCLGHLA